MVWARVLRVSNSTHQSADSRENPASRRESFLSESGRTRAIHCPMPLCTYVMLEVHPAIAKLVSWSGWTHSPPHLLPPLPLPSICAICLVSQQLQISGLGPALEATGAAHQHKHALIALALHWLASHRLAYKNRLKIL